MSDETEADLASDELHEPEEALELADSPMPEETADHYITPETMQTGDSTMAYPTAVNDQITDAVTQTNVTVLSEAPSMAMGSIYQSLAHSLSLMYANAVTAQQNLNVIAQAASTVEVEKSIEA